MKPIPAALQEKLKNRFKADSMDSAPHLSIVASQASYNTLLTEPIHKDIAPALGDVALRQLPGEKDISMAYAICLDNGYAQVYRRLFPAFRDNAWEYLWTLGPAEDVAIEFHGRWAMDASKAWYYLQTDEFPYLFFTQEDNLYVQYWDDATTRTMLAEGVSQLSACKGWQSADQPELDQGLIIGYLRDGAVFYRAYCCQDDGSFIWEHEHQVEPLGNTNSTLSVIRTNDFRVGFLTESNGGMHLVLSSRNYAGLVIRPENVFAYAKVAFHMVDIKDRDSYHNETVTAQTVLPYFAVETTEMAEEDCIHLLRVDRLNREDAFFSYGFKLYFDRVLDKPDMGEIVKAVAFKIDKDTRSVVSASYDAAERAVSVFLNADIKRTIPLTITVESMRTIQFSKARNVKWYLPEFTADIPPDLNYYYGYTGEGVSIADTQASMCQIDPEFYLTRQDQCLQALCTASMEYVPVKDMPL